MALYDTDTDDTLDPSKRVPLQDNLGMGPVKVASPMGGPSLVPPIGRPVSDTGVPMYNKGDEVPATGTATAVNPHIAEAQRMEQQGSGVSQVQAKHPFWGGVLRGLDVAASVAAPRIAPEIPGTTAHHNALIGQQEGLANQDIAQQEHEAQTQEIQQKPQMQQAAMQHQDQLEAEKEAARQAQQTQAQKEQQDHLDQTLGQQQNVADQREEIADANRQSSEAKADQRFALQERNADRRAAQGGNIGTWSMAEDPQTGKPVLFNSKTGKTMEAPAGVAPKGNFAKNVAPIEGAKNYATSYLQNGNFTGPGDEALQEKFFELAKPSTGFRMSQPQINQLQQSRNWVNSIQGQAYHALHGTWFSPEQRQQIVQTMNDLAVAKEQTQGGGAAPAPHGGGTVNMTAPDGTTKPVPADQVEHYKSLGAKVAQ